MSEDQLQRKISRLAEIMKQEKDEIHTSTYEGLESYHEDLSLKHSSRNNKSHLTFSKYINEKFSPKKCSN
jgi:hypothetical protein